MIDFDFWKKHYTAVVKFLYITFVKGFPIYIECLLEFLMIKNRKYKSIKHKIILVTGGGGVIGRQVAKHLAKHDNESYVVVADICYDAARSTAEFIKNEHQINSFAYKVDVSDYNSVSELRKLILSDLGYVDMIINSAEMVNFDSILDKEWQEVEQILQTNLHAHFWMTKVFLPDMLQRKSGHIVGISSIIGYFHSPYTIAYTTSKYGINGFMRCLQDELIAEGHGDYIKTTLACPYFMREDIKEARMKFSPLTPDQSGKMIVDGILRNKSEIIVAKFPFVVKLAMILPKKVVNLIMMEYLPEIQTKREIHAKEQEEECDEYVSSEEEILIDDEPNGHKDKKIDSEIVTNKVGENQNAEEGDCKKRVVPETAKVAKNPATENQITDIDGAKDLAVEVPKKDLIKEAGIVAGWMSLTMTSKMEKDKINIKTE